MKEKEKAKEKEKEIISIFNFKNQSFESFTTWQLEID